MMTLALLFDLVLAPLVLAVAAWTVVVRDSFTAVVGFVAYGLLLALVWVRLAAVDVAMTEAAIGGGATGILLLGAVARLRPTEAASLRERSGLAMRLVTGLLCAFVAAGLAAAVLFLPEPAPSLAPQALEPLPELGVGNAVAAVLKAYRGYDTLMEKVVLVLAVIGVWSLAPDRCWGGRPGRAQHPQAEGPLALLGRLLPPIGIVVAIHIVWVGADEPGGAFQGGTILAALWVLAIMAGLVEVPAIGRTWLRLAITGGAILFMLVGFLGFFLADGFLAYPAGFAKPLILLIEAALVLGIAAMIALLVLGPPEREPGP